MPIQLPCVVVSVLTGGGRRSGGGGRAGRRVEEQPAEDGVRPGQARDRDHHVPADRPVQVDSPGERRERLGVQDGPRGGVGDLDLLAPPRVVPVDRVEREVVRLAVGQVDVDREAGAEYQQAAMRPGAAGVWRARGSVVLAAQV